MAKYPAWTIDEVGRAFGVLWQKQVGPPVRRIEFVLPNKRRYGLEIAVGIGQLNVVLSSASKKPFIGRWWDNFSNGIFTFCTETEHSPFEQGCLATDWAYDEFVMGSLKIATMTLEGREGTTFQDRLNFLQSLAGFIVGQLAPKVEWQD